MRAAIIAANTNGDTSDTINLAAGNYTLSLVGANEDAAATGDLDNKIGLANGLTYQQLMFSQEGDRVKISLTSTGEVLAYLNNFTLNLLDLNDFVLA
ncbi:MAG: hypothetical protein RMY36_033395 [Nostoc sp. SerVER01]|nr:hypothetical protein [Nostoc sp. SerVER01]